MKTTQILYLPLAASVALAHYTFPDLIFGGKTSSDYQYVRLTTNHYSNAPVTDVTSSDMTCYADPSHPSTSTATVAAGSTVGFTVNPDVYHPGPLLFYMAKVPSGQTAASFDGSGSVWFKIYQNSATITSSSISWPSGMTTVSVTIPSCIESGDYLLRVEHIALHSASTVGGAQLYIACGQLTVTGGGSTAGGPTVAIPGAYSATDPGLLLNIYYPIPSSYTPPGPPVFQCGAQQQQTTLKTTTKATTTAQRPTTTPVVVVTTKSTTKSTTTSPPARTTTPIVDGQPQYAQCGGQGWTGGTTCQANFKCNAINPYYSQCL
ncbi:Endoglucanase-4 [Arthrobotrys entomopaga]|nr:Endoglucanase-4 [Arthrobotrys entomopaga]